MMNSRKKFTVGVTVSVIIAIILVVMVNVFLTVLNDKIPLKIDMTANKRYELTERTTEFLKTYDTPVTIYVFESVSRQDADVKAVLERYAQLNDNIKIVNINPAENPTFGKEYTSTGGTLSSNSVIVASDKRYRVFTLTSLYSGNNLTVENKITPALKYVARDTEFKAYLLNGHGELNADGIAKKLKDETYEVEELDLTLADIPEDAGLVISFRPVADFSNDELTRLDVFLERGGNFQVYFDIDSNALGNLYRYLKDWGVGVTDNIAVEVDEGHTTSNGYFDAHFAEIWQSDFTQSIIDNRRKLAYLAFGKALDIEFETNGARRLTPLLSTSEMTFTAEDSQMNPAQGVPEGARMLAALCTDSDNGGSVYVSGTTMFLSVEESRLSDTNIAGVVNYEYFANLVEYTLDGDSSVASSEKSVVGESLMMNEQEKTLVRNIVVIFIPLAVLVCGIVVWIKRRNL